jgi:hypothetical protein
MTINDIIKVEKDLLQIQKEKKFQMNLSELITLTKYIKEVGEITSLYFNTLYDFSKTINNIKQLTDYKEKIDGCFLNEDIDLCVIKQFINKIFEKYSIVS